MVDRNLGLLINKCYKSKCSEFNLLGCLKIKRNIEAEIKVDLKKDDIESNTLVNTIKWLFQ